MKISLIDINKCPRIIIIMHETYPSSLLASPPFHLQSIVTETTV